MTSPYHSREDFHEVARLALTRRQIEALQLLASDDIPALIAKQLCLSLHSLKNMQTDIYRKLGVNSRCGAVVRALQLGIITLPGAATLDASGVGHVLPGGMGSPRPPLQRQDAP